MNGVRPVPNPLGRSGERSLQLTVLALFGITVVLTLPNAGPPDKAKRDALAADGWTVLSF